MKALYTYLSVIAAAAASAAAALPATNSVTFSWCSAPGIATNVFCWWTDDGAINGVTNVGPEMGVTVALPGNERCYNWTVDGIDTNGCDNWAVQPGIWYSPVGYVQLSCWAGARRVGIQSTYDLTGETSYWTTVTNLVGSSVLLPVSPVQFFRACTTDLPPVSLSISPVE